MFILNKIFRTKEQEIYQDPYEEIMKFSIICKLYKEEDEQYILLSKNTEIVFDKLMIQDDTNVGIHECYDFVMIVRLHRASKKFKNIVYDKSGDYYFNIDYFQQIIHSQLNEEVEEFSFQLIDSQKIQWKLRAQFQTLNQIDRTKVNNFMTYILKLMWINQNRKSISFITNEAYRNNLIVKQLPPPKLKDSIAIKKNQQIVKFDKSILRTTLQRNTKEKELIGELLNYFLETTGQNYKQLFVGQLYALNSEDQQVQLINNIIIVGFNKISVKNQRFEIYNQDRQLILQQSVNEYINFTFDKKYLSWLYRDGDYSVVLFIKFDTFDGSSVIQIQINKAKAKLEGDSQWIEKCIKNQQKIISDNESISSESTQLVQQTNEKYKLLKYDDGQLELDLNIQDKFFRRILTIYQDYIILLYNHTFVLIKKNQIEKRIVLEQKFQYNQALLSTDQQQLFLFQKNENIIYQFSIAENAIKKVQIPSNLQQIVSFNDQIYVLCQNLIYQAKCDNNLQLNLISQVTKLEFSCLALTSDGCKIIGTKQGEIVIEDDNNKLINQIPTFTDEILQIIVAKNCQDFVILNCGSYLLYQRLITEHENGYRQQFTLTPFPLRIEILPEDLLMLCIFDIPMFNNVRLDDDGQILIAQISNIHFIWDISQIKEGYTTLYDIKMQQEPSQDIQIHKLQIISLDTQLRIRIPLDN